MNQHTYIIPYYENNNKTFILLAKKKFFSHKDGFLHSNANQLVLIGGHLDKKNKNNIIGNIEKEFLEETGYKINRQKISLLETNNKTKCYFVGIYKCNNIEYNNFSDFDNLNKDKKFVELNDLIWVNLENAKSIMKSHNSSLNIDYMAKEYVYNYIKNIHENNPWYSLTELKKFYKKYYEINKNMTNKQIIRKYIFPKIKKGDKNLIEKLNKTIKKYIEKNNYYDWFLESIDSFEKYKKKSISSKSISSKSIKRKYIPPHLRKKN